MVRKLILLLLIPITCYAVEIGGFDPQGTVTGVSRWELVEEREIGAMAANTNLLLRMEGADADTTTVDSTETHTITANGTAQLDTAQVKFGSTSLLLDGNSDYLTAPDSADWYFGTGDFTIDYWIRFNSITGAQTPVIQFEDNNNRWWCHKASDHVWQFRFIDGGVAQGYYSFSWTPSVDTWYHMEWVRSGTGAYVFIDGTSQTLTENTAFSTNDVGDMAGLLYVGRGEITPSFFYVNGWMDEVRISKGVARHTANFTPETAPYDGPTNQVTFSGLSGDTDESYKMIGRLINDDATTVYYYLNPNNSQTGDKGTQEIKGINVTISAVVNDPTSSWAIASGGITAGQLAICDMTMYAETGKGRTALISSARGISGTQINETGLWGCVWNDTSTALSSLVLKGVNITHQAQAIGEDSHLLLYKKVDN